MADKDANPPDPYSLSGGIGRLQDTIKWVMAVFAGIAGVLTAGTQVSKLGVLSASDPRLYLAALGGVVALVGVGTTIVFATRVLVGRAVTIQDLIAIERLQPLGVDMRFVKSADLLQNYDSVQALWTLRDRAQHAQRLAEKHGMDKEAATEAQHVADLDDIILNLLLGVRWRRTRDDFWVAIRVSVGAGACTALAIGLFAWAANPTLVPGNPIGTASEAYLSLTPAGQAALVSTLGPQCVTAPVLVEVIGASKGGFDLSTIKTASCAQARFTFADPSLGMLSPAPSQVIATATPVVTASPAVAH